MEPFEINLSVQMGMKLAQLESRVQVANQIMKEVMDAYQRVCASEQQRMDILMLSICEMHNKELPQDYEYSFDPINMKVLFRSRSQQPTILVNGSQS